ncbi:hypothetical protein COJ85_03030 [Bacillus sp. AFS076308]|uniref:hypothetical protein n=1 Tax=unclassified Bacillus (in: firmicutes) TaxID=185979 RepID=UPI000BF42A29|nr:MULTISPECIES: hypothetical protein [unclassified Bacillus (in: firmicutes)]PFO08480.1 hypothetical protein COJ85_03030 [Bacillus sp. AFS076308]PGV54707.1 hypothetical protein COD92_04090 [Bacillus sp. AFS037270]
MFYKILLFLGCGFLLSACSPQEKQTHKEVNTEVKVKPKSYTREITEEEQKYIQLVINKDYDTLMKLTIGQSNEVLKDYYNIAFSLKEYQELQRSDTETNNLGAKYQYIALTLKALKYVPDEIKNQIDEVKTSANDKYQYYFQLANQETQNKKVYERTVDPQPVIIGMTSEEVLTEGWGRPSDINRTTSASGVSEQWVYPGYKYIYIF